MESAAESAANGGRAYPTLTDEAPLDLPPGVVYPGAVPHQRGTLYSGQPAAGEMTSALPPNFAGMDHAPENTGSLTGHILSAGWSDSDQRERRSNTKVVVVMTLVFLTLVGGSLLMLFLANDVFSSMFGGLFKD